MATARPRRNATRASRTPGACGGTPKRNGSGGGVGNRNTVRQPPKRRK